MSGIVESLHNAVNGLHVKQDWVDMGFVLQIQLQKSLTKF